MVQTHSSNKSIYTMSPSTGRKGRSDIFCFTRAITLLFTFQIWFVLSKETNLKVSGDTKEAFLQQSISISGMLSPGEFNRKEIVVLAYFAPPLFYYQKTNGGNYTFGGFFNDHLELIFGYLKTSLKYIIVDPALVVKYGHSGASLTYLDKKEIDVVPVGFLQVWENSKHMELVTPYDMNYFTLLQPYPGEESHLDVIIRPFELSVWMCFLVTTAVFVVVSAIIIKNRMDVIDSNSSQKSTIQAIYNQLDYVFRHFTNQGTSGTHARTRSSFKILTGIWLLSMVVLINAYSGVLTSLLTVPKLRPIAKTLKDVAESQELRVTVEKENYFSRIFLNATKGYEKILGDQLRKDPTLLTSDAVACRENVIHHKAAYPGLKPINNYFMNMNKLKKDHCQMAVSPELKAYPSLAYQFAFPIGSPYAETYSKAELLMWANGMIEYEQRLMKATDKCRVDKPLEAITRTLTLFDLSPAFLILGVGIPLATFCFAVEILSTYILSLSLGK